MEVLQKKTAVSFVVIFVPIFEKEVIMVPKYTVKHRMRLTMLGIPLGLMIGTLLANYGRLPWDALIPLCLKTLLGGIIGCALFDILFVRKIQG
jgi:hypothetical protein